jgi:hypothetical protein
MKQSTLIRETGKRLALLIGVCGAFPLFGQPVQQVLPNPDCQFFFSLTSANQFLPAGNGFDNRTQGCTTWSMAENVSGFSGLTVTLQTAANSAGSAGSWGAGFPIQQNTLSGSNAITSTTGGFWWVQGTNAFVRVQLTGTTGTGVVTGAVFGWRIPGAGGVGDAIGCSGSTCTVPSGKSLTIGTAVPGVSSPMLSSPTLPNSLTTLYPVAKSPVLPNLGRAPRIMVTGESILNVSDLASEIQTAIPGALIDQRTYSGSEIPLGLLVSATSVQSYTQTGQLLPTTVLTSWSAGTGTTVAASTDPITTLPAYLITVTGVTTQQINYAGTGFTVPSGAPDITFSCEVDESAGTYSGPITLELLDKTNGYSTIIVQEYPSSIWSTEGLPVRIFVHVNSGTGAGYSASDALGPYVQIRGVNSGLHPAGTLYVSNCLANAGDIPSVYHNTSGSAEAAAAIGWTPATEGLRRPLYDLVVVEWGANDASNATPLYDYERMLSAQLSGALQLSPRVLLTTPPPVANAGLTAWNPSADPFPPYRLIGLREALRYGVFFYDAWTAFQSLTTAGTYTVAQLMNNTVHPSDPVGVGQYVNAIAAAAVSLEDTPSVVGPSGPTALLGCQPASGTWTWASLAGPAPPQELFWGFYGNTSARYQYAIGASSGTCTYSITGSVIGLIALTSTSAASVNVSIDGQPSVTIGLQNSGAANPQAQGFYVGSVPSGTHTVTVTVASGTAYLIGVVAAP